MIVALEEYKSRFKLVLISETPQELEQLRQVKEKTGNTESPNTELHLTLGKVKKDED
ncbi:hypothetical protein MASR1M48_16640 [Lactococcus petauri]